MDDAQKAPAPSETERAVEVAKGLDRRLCRKLLEANEWAATIYRPSKEYELCDMGLLTEPTQWHRDPLTTKLWAFVVCWWDTAFADEWGTSVCTPMGRLVARSLKGEG